MVQLVKKSACKLGDLGLILELGRSPGEGIGYPLQYSGLEHSMDCIVHGVAKSWTRLSYIHFQEGETVLGQGALFYIVLSTEFKLSCLLCNHQF